MADNKLRVAIPNSTHALDLVKAEVQRATGFAVEPEFQEIDHSALIVEVRLAESDSAQPGDVARLVEGTAPELDLLSPWRESPFPCAAVRVSNEAVLDAFDDSMPPAARRALRDDLPTAEWLSVKSDTTGQTQSHWLLAVPLVSVSTPTRIYIRRRAGYALRFGAHDAAAARSRLAS